MDDLLGFIVVVSMLFVIGFGVITILGVFL